MPIEATDELTQLIDSVRAGPKYRQVAPDLIGLVGAQELAKRRNLKAAVKATKNKLHQIFGAYWHDQPAFADWLTLLQEAQGDEQLLQATCRTLMAHHASTRERLATLNRFYVTLFAGLGPVYSVLDLACGLNPLTLPWMPLAPNATYLACDIAQDQVDFLQNAMHYLGVNGSAQLCDLLQGPPVLAEPVDVALLLKTIPCLEQVDRQIGARLLTQINASVLLVSFPAQSLGGRNKGMINHYGDHFATLVAAQGWPIEEFLLQNELVFRVHKRVDK